ncbi:hypothetical protein DO97_16985 [Neosynechococcus sphagnicola sy1]|uniref:Uncharacterized protein n=1 Tax=Neosynechococcus sphagnicola sy1 TaxID=1497020 RepID=A0A098THT3_9CYAN|nr:hypothetical protein [Neosynechococcus sphagnicola]KGF71659.1 hypothetical protein DO97_16985 [Neosynechococcus sphagnicola sy1]
MGKNAEVSVDDLASALSKNPPPTEDELQLLHYILQERKKAARFRFQSHLLPWLTIALLLMTVAVLGQ